MPLPKVLVFQHVAHEPLGTLDPLLKKAGLRIRYVNFGRKPDYRPSLDGFSGLIILGGPMNANDVSNYPFLDREVQLIQEALDRDLSILGICLGAQLLAKALGGAVHAGGATEIGWYHVDVTDAGRTDPLLSTFGARNEVFQWHDDGIELPSGVAHLASSPVCPVQAFRHGQHAYGLQFHLEVDRGMIERWLRVSDRQAAASGEPANYDAEHIRRRTPDSIGPLMSLSDHTFSRWIERFQIPARRRILSSRHPA